jgi:heme exporter protein CcmD
MTEIVTSPHFGFILAAYAVTVVIVLGMIGAIVLDHHTLRQALARISQQTAATENDPR